MNHLKDKPKTRLIVLYQRLYQKYPTDEDLQQFIQDGEGYEERGQSDEYFTGN